MMLKVSVSEQEGIRREKREALQALGINPYPSSFSVNAWAREILENHQTRMGQEVSLGGRLMARRVMGRVVFATLQDSTGRIQLYIHRDTLCPDEDKSWYQVVFKKLID